MGLYFPHVNVEVFVTNRPSLPLKPNNDHREEQIQNFNEAHHQATDIHARGPKHRGQNARTKIGPEWSRC